MAAFKNQELLNKMGSRLKELREANQLTQEAFYTDTGINPSRIESGRRNMSVSTLYAICKYFGITIQQFFDGIKLK